MVESFFGLREEPFSIAPDPRFLYMSGKHREALVLLDLGLTRGASFVLLTGEIGAGKTTVWRRFLEQLPPNVDVASVVNPKLDVNALLKRVFEDLQVDLPPGAGDLIDVLHGHILLASAQGRRTLIVIDEAQALSMDVLEQLRLLTNLDASGKKLQVMLIAQPEMRQILERPALEPLAQRIVARYHLRALSDDETIAYIQHRMQVAGLTEPLPFDGEALAMIHRLCAGVPRRINVLCDRALTLAASLGVRRIGREIIDRARGQAFGEATVPMLAPVPQHLATQPAPAPPLPVRHAPAPPHAAPPASAPAPHAGPPSSPALQPHSAPPPHAASPPPAAAFSAPPPRPPRQAPVAATVISVAVLALVAGVVIGPRFWAAPPAVALAPVPLPVTAAPAPVPAPMPMSVPVPVPVPSIESAFTPAAAEESLALRTLAGRWGVELAPGDPCAAAAEQALSCFRTRGGLATIRQLDRPGLLRLVDERGRVAYAQLLALRDDAAVLSVAGVQRNVPLGELVRWWRGDFTTFWRVPLGYREGESGGAWLARQLARADGGAPPAEAELRSRVHAFQLAKGLVPDGIAGPLTLMQLNRANGVDEPRLGSAVTSDSRPS